MSDPYQEGFGARRDGATIWQNPYATMTEDFDKWEQGWLAQDEHLSDRDEALDSIGWFG